LTREEINKKIKLSPKIEPKFN